MSLTDRFANRFAKPATHAVDASVRDVVQQVLKEHGYASPAEVQALRDEVRDARRRADALDAKIQAIADRPAGPDPRIAEMTIRITELEARLAALHTRPTVTVSTPTLTAAPAEGCKVDDCGADVRSKGFCSPHYQQWRRGSLPGFVGPEGTIVADKRLLHVHTRFAGGKVQIEGKKVLVDGKEATTVKGW